MKALVACDLPESALEALGSLGLNVDYQPDIPTEDIASAVRDASLLIVGRGRVSREVFSAGQSLQMVVRRGVDVHNIDVDAASAEGVFVTHCPQAGAAAIAELFFAQLLALDRGIVERAADLRGGRPQDEVTISARGLCGRTLAVLGEDPVASRVAHCAGALDMQVRMWSPDSSDEAEPPAAAGPRRCAYPSEAVRAVDALAAYAPSGRIGETLIDAALIDDVPDHALFAYIGAPNGFDAAALSRAVRERGLRVALDLQTTTGQTDGVRIKSDLLQLPGVIGTRFLWNRTQQAREATAAEVVEIVTRFLVAGEVLNCVNLLERSGATWLLVLRLRDAPGVLAEILDVIRADGINAEEITNRVFHGARAAWCTVALDERPSSEALDAIAKLGGVLNFDLRAIV